MSDTPRLLCIGTHHKTGTVWMRRVWRGIGEALNIPFIGVHRPAKWQEKAPAEGRAILVNWGGKFAPDLWEQADARFLHIIRDPRDVLLSGQRYHETSTAPTEKWLHRPDPELGGQSYQQKMQSLASREEKLRFELDGVHAKTLAEMLAWPYGHDRACDIRYEDLIVDKDCALFARTMRFMGFHEKEVETGCRIFYENSIFGGLSADPTIGRTKTHVKSGKPAQWIAKLPRAVAETYLNRHGDDLIALGYENDRTWLDRLQPEPPAAPRDSLSIVIKTCVTREARKDMWGDHHFAAGLAGALERRGHKVRIDSLPEWDRDPDFGDCDLILRGTRPFRPTRGRAAVMWVLYPGGTRADTRAQPPEILSMDAVLYASSPALAAHLRNPALASVPASLMLQAFDANRMFVTEDATRAGFVFVGSNHMGGGKRPMPHWAEQAGLDPIMHGRGWPGSPLAHRVASNYLPNTALGETYRSAQAVLCDHSPNMRTEGYVSNRIFDALACGTLVICDAVEGLPEEFEPHVWRCNSADDVAAAANAIRNETEADRTARAAFARESMEAHSFDARAEELEPILRDAIAARQAPEKRAAG